MDEWGYAQEDPAEQLARLHYFSIKKLQDGAAIEFKIIVKEYAKPPLGALKFIAQADRQTNQKVAPYTPHGWGNTWGKRSAHVCAKSNASGMKANWEHDPLPLSMSVR